MDIHSSDLWVAGGVNGAKDTGKTAGVDYAIGAAAGPVTTAKVEFMDYTIDDQAFSACLRPAPCPACLTLPFS